MVSRDLSQAASSVRTRPILFSAPMVRALLAGTKTQTRRIVKPQPHHGPIGTMVNLGGAEWAMDDGDLSGLWRCPYGVPGDRLWVREAWTKVPATAYRMSEGVQQVVNPADRYEAAIFAAGWDRSIPKWKPSIHMPRWASRISLRVTGVRVERLNEIDDADSMAEGIGLARKVGWRIDDDGESFTTPRLAYRTLWERINGPGSWAVNPWVWAVTFAIADTSERQPQIPGSAQ